MKQKYLICDKKKYLIFVNGNLEAWFSQIFTLAIGIMGHGVGYLGGLGLGHFKF